MEGRSDGLMEGREMEGQRGTEGGPERADSRRGGGQRGHRGASGAAGPLRESSRRPRAAADRRREPPRRAAAPLGAAAPPPPPPPRPPPARQPPPASRVAQRSRADPDGTDRSRQGGTGRAQTAAALPLDPKSLGPANGGLPQNPTRGCAPLLAPPSPPLPSSPSPSGPGTAGRPRSRDCRQLGPGRAGGPRASLFPPLPAAG